MRPVLLSKIILICSMALGSTTLSAQQDPLYSQYFNNPMLINPAFAGIHDRLYAGLAYRSQWSGIDGGPTTFNFNGHISLLNNKLGAGIIAVQDKVGDIKNTQYGGTFAYHIKGVHATFSFGMQAGFIRYSTDLQGVLVRNADPLFAPFSETKFNTGVGILMKGERYSIGLSVPQLLSSSVSMGGQSIQIYQQHYYLYSGYLFYLSEQIQFKPTTLLRLTHGSPLSVDFNANLTFSGLYTAGLFTRNLNTYGLLVQAIFGNVRAGYVFELPGKGSALNFNTHEISLAISLDVLDSHNHSSTGF